MEKDNTETCKTDEDIQSNIKQTRTQTDRDRYATFPHDDTDT